MRTRRRFPLDERGTALLLALALATILSALGAVLALTAQTETLIAGRFQQSREAHYVAEGALARALQDLSTAADWNSALEGVPSSFRDGDAVSPREVAGAGRIVLCCDATSLSAAVQRTAHAGRSWDADTPLWRLYAWGPVSSWLPSGLLHSPFYVAVWVADDPADGDGNPVTDANSVVELYSVALGPAGGKRGVRAVVARPRDAGGTPLPGGVRVLSSHEARW